VAIFKPKDAEALALLVREPDNAKFIGGEKAQEVARRRALFVRLQPLDDAAGAAWTKHEKAVASAIAKRDAAALALRDANNKLAQANHAKSAELNAMTAERDGIERELLAGADQIAIAAFRSELLDEQTTLMRSSAIVSRHRTVRNMITRGKIGESTTNVNSVARRIAAIGEAFPKIDALKLEPDQSKLAERFAEIKSELPAIDTNPDFPT
jgi:hypothetical protein